MRKLLVGSGQNKPQGKSSGCQPFCQPTTEHLSKRRESLICIFAHPRILAPHNWRVKRARLVRQNHRLTSRRDRSIHLAPIPISVAQQHALLVLFKCHVTQQNALANTRTQRQLVDQRPPSPIHTTDLRARIRQLYGNE